MKSFVWDSKKEPVERRSEYSYSRIRRTYSPNSIICHSIPFSATISQFTSLTSSPKSSQVWSATSSQPFFVQDARKPRAHHRQRLGSSNRTKSNRTTKAKKPKRHRKASWHFI
mmetsp:Transcript_7752/g.14723  ORF Transcript_7752/g.14723 Transcript_7752/m.14723 type:complete len:113 (+) Transcript_7752:4324-4662(+)